MGTAEQPFLPTRIASVAYLNAAPLTVALDRGRFDVVTGHPSEIAAMLHRREVDVALVPVAAVLDDPDLRIVPGVAIGADGPVDSVLLVGEVPPEQWTTVLLDGSSRTSAALTRVLLDGHPTIRAELVPVPVGEGPKRAGGTTATLVIGDAARELPDRFGFRLDLGQMWRERTGLPFVFAVWAGRPGLDPRVVSALRDAASVGLARRYADHAGDDLIYLTERVRYELGDRQLMGLRRFAALAQAKGLVRHDNVHLYPPVPRPAPPSHEDLIDKALDDRALTAGELASLAVDTPIGDLSLAGALRRRRLFGAATVTHAPPETGVGIAWFDGTLAEAMDAILEAGRPFYAPSLTRVAAVAAAAGRPLAAVLGALADAGLVGFAGDAAGDDPDTVRAALRELPDGLSVVLSYRADGDIGRLHALASLDHPAIRGIVVCGAMPQGAMVSGEAPTPVGTLRAVALARLASRGRVGVHLPSVGPDIGQLALRGGADDLGLSGVQDPAAGLAGCAAWVVSVAEAERMIRAAGFEPGVRDASFSVISGAVTRPEHIRRAGIVARR